MSNLSQLDKPQKCCECGKSVYATEKLDADNRIYHKACFRCKKCNGVLKLGSYASMEGIVYCKPCFKKLFFSKGNYSEGFGKLKPQQEHDLKSGKSSSGYPGGEQSEEEERKQKQDQLEEARKKRDEELAKRDEEQKLKREQENQERDRKRKEEEEKKKKDEEARKLKEDEDKKRRADERKASDEERKKKLDEEKKKKEEEERKRKDDEEKKKKEDQERKKREEAEKLKSEEEKKRKETERLRLLEEAKKARPATKATTAGASLAKSSSTPGDQKKASTMTNSYSPASDDKKDTEQLKESVQALEKQLTEEKQLRSAAEARLEELKQQDSNQSSNWSSDKLELEVEVTKLRRQIEDEREDHRRDLDVERRANSEIKTMMEELEEKHEREVRSLKRQLDSAAESQTKSGDSNNDTELAQLRARVREQEEEIKQLQALVAELQKETEDQQADVKKLIAANGELRAENVTLKIASPSSSFTLSSSSTPQKKNHGIFDEAENGTENHKKSNLFGPDGDASSSPSATHREKLVNNIPATTASNSPPVSKTPSSKSKLFDSLEDDKNFWSSANPKEKKTDIFSL